MLPRCVVIAVLVLATLTVIVECVDIPDQLKDKIARNPELEDQVKEILANIEANGAGTDKKKKGGDAQPNIVFILLDDLGYNDLGYQNSEVITPNIDALANNGVILDYNYVAPVCTPSRHSLMTGTYAWKHGMSHLVLAENNPVCVPLELKMLPERLSEAGYQTHMMGKWHLGFCDSDCTPPARGFDTYMGIYGGYGSFWYHVTDEAYDWHKDYEVDLSANGTYATDLIGDRGIELLQEEMDLSRPFFWYVSHLAPHTPIQVDQEYIDMYDGVTFSDDTKMDLARKMYLGMITKVDETIGEMVAEMKAQGVYDNTVFIFSADNGGEYGEYQQSSNAPLRGGKASLFEGGSRVAGFVSSPLLPQGMQGVRLQEIIHEVDWTPTLAHLAGVPVSDAEIDGVDQYATIFEGAASPRTEVVYNIDMAFPQLFGQAAIRVNEYKLIWGHYGFSDGYANQTYGFWMSPSAGKRDLSKRSWTFDEETNAMMMGIIMGNSFVPSDVDSGLVMLFNLVDDPEERTDLAGDPAYADKILELKNRLLELINADYVDPDPGYANAVPRADILQDGAWNYGWCEK